MPRMCAVALLLVAVLGLHGVADAARACTDEPKCRCQSIGGKWLLPPDAPMPTCRWYMSHQGQQRYADVFLPANFNKGGRYPLWTILHGLTYNGWWDRKVQLSRPVRGGEAFAYVSGVTRGPLRNQAILVFPDSLGDSTKRQFWNSQFWRCVQGTCINPATDDLGFLEVLMQRLVNQLPVDSNQVFMSGYSNGAMMLQTALCSSPRLMRLVKAIALAKSSINQRYFKDNCPAVVGMKMPLLMLSSTGDATFSYKTDDDVMGTPMFGAERWTHVWAQKRACSFPAASPVNKGHFSCHDACCNFGFMSRSGAAAGAASRLASAAGAPLTRACTLWGGSHSWNTPEYGLENKLIWQFFQDAVKSAAAAAGVCPALWEPPATIASVRATAVAAVAKPTKKVPSPSPRPTPSPNPRSAPKASPATRPTTKQSPRASPPPSQTPRPSPTPTTTPIPRPTPTPRPNPTPSPSPSPSPTPEPRPEPIPEPRPQPRPEPVPQPMPEPVPEPRPEPSPKPVAEPSREPNPEPSPQPSPSPASAPTSSTPAAPQEPAPAGSTPTGPDSKASKAPDAGKDPAPAPPAADASPAPTIDAAAPQPAAPSSSSSTPGPAVPSPSPAQSQPPAAAPSSEPPAADSSSSPASMQTVEASGAAISGLANHSAESAAQPDPAPAVNAGPGVLSDQLGDMGSGAAPESSNTSSSNATGWLSDIFSGN